MSLEGAFNKPPKESELTPEDLELIKKVMEQSPVVEPKEEQSDGDQSDPNAHPTPTPEQSRSFFDKGKDPHKLGSQNN